MLKGAGAEPGQRLAFLAADLERDGGWADAVAGCDYVIHVASPIPAAAPKTEDELIVPARDGVLRVLKAARDAKVKRVVLTSSCGAIYYGHPAQTAPFDETSWTNTGGEMSAYVRSKAIAERAAWDFRRGRRARRGRPPPPRDDGPGGEGRALHRRLRRDHVDARHREGAQGAPGRCGEESTDTAVAELARTCRRAV